jgi:hypothetical protein
MSWNGLCALSAPTLPAAVRRKLEVAILTEQQIRLLHVQRARQSHEQRKRPGRPARMAGVTERSGLPSIALVARRDTWCERVRREQ